MIWYVMGILAPPALFLAGFAVAWFTAREPGVRWTEGYREALLTVQRTRQMSRDYGDTRAGMQSLDLTLDEMVASCDRQLGYRK